MSMDHKRHTQTANFAKQLELSVLPQRVRNTVRAMGAKSMTIRSNLIQFDGPKNYFTCTNLKDLIHHYLVNVKEKSCSCREMQGKSFPCSHRLRAIGSADLDLSNFLSVYARIIEPLISTYFLNNPYFSVHYGFRK